MSTLLRDLNCPRSSAGSSNGLVSRRSSVRSGPVAPFFTAFDFGVTSLSRWPDGFEPRTQYQKGSRFLHAREGKHKAILAG